MNVVPHEEGSAYAAMIATRDHVRLPSWSGAAAGHKEWFHFSLCTDDVDLLLNFSVVATDTAGPPTCRLTWIVRERGWHGEVTTCPPERARVHGGEVAARLGGDAFVFADGAFQVSVRGRRRPVSVDLRLEPIASPAMFHNIPAGGRASLHWFVVPSLRARGTVVVDGRRHEVDATAYHDHNWGRFRWGGDFAWEWGYASAPAPHRHVAVVFSRMSDRALHRTLRQGVFVWRDGLPCRVLRGDRVCVRREGLLRAGEVPKFPPILDLRHPGTATDVPRRLVVHAASGEDHLDYVAEIEDVAAILVPADGDDEGVTRIHEAVARVEVEGVLAGERFAFACRSMLEFLRG